MPTGLVKSMIQASGSARCRARSAMSRTIGTVRSALASPPAPVVSCPTQPQSSGQVSSALPGGLAADPELEQDRARARRCPSSRLSVQLTRGRVPVRAHDPGRHRPDRGQPALVGVDQDQLGRP